MLARYFFNEVSTNIDVQVQRNEITEKIPVNFRMCFGKIWRDLGEVTFKFSATLFASSDVNYPP